MVEKISAMNPMRKASRALVGCKDPSSFANLDECRATSLALDLRVDFDRKVLEGEARLSFRNVAPLSKGILVSKAAIVENNLVLFLFFCCCLLEEAKLFNNLPLGV